MRKTLLASAAILGTASGAWAQMEATPSMFQSQGQMAMPWAGGPSPNNNNNALGTAKAGGTKIPIPGSVVIRLNGRVYAEGDLSFSSLGTIPAGTYNNIAANVPKPTPGYKLNPVGMAAYFRMYPGIDGMATNGLRYGASAEIRMNLMGGNNFGGNIYGSTSATNSLVTTTQTAVTGTAAGASGNSSSETLFVRRAFTYIGSDQAGIVRLGIGDGVISLFDYTGVFTSGSWDGGIGNILNASVQAVTPNNYLLSWVFLSGNGQEYDNAKVVYLSPQFYGFDFAAEYDPNMGNSFSNSATSSPYQVGPCAAASADCIAVTSGNDGSRWYNRVAVGLRYQGNFSGFDVKAYGVYAMSAVESTPVGVQRFSALNMWNGGVALSYLGFTLNSDFTFGRTNGTNALAPSGGAGAGGYLVGFSYANGPWSGGVIGAIVNTQGATSPALLGISQRHEMAVAFGGAYKLAPGITVAAEYQYLQKHQGAFNFANGAAGLSAAAVAAGSLNYNNIKTQGIQLATIVSW